MPHRYAHGGGLRYMDYDASAESNALRFPSNGRGGTTATFAGCDVDGYVPAVHMISVTTVAAENQTITLTTSDGTVVMSQTIGVGEAAGEGYCPAMQSDATIRGSANMSNAANARVGFEIRNGFGIQIATSAGNAVAVRVWYSVV